MRTTEAKCFICSFDLGIGLDYYPSPNQYIYRTESSDGVVCVSVDYPGPIPDPNYTFLLYIHDKCWSEATGKSKERKFDDLEWIEFAGKEWEPVCEFYTEGGPKLNIALPKKYRPTGRPVYEYDE